jgi:polar amino acid transport system substrate-binding protein
MIKPILTIILATLISSSTYASSLKSIKVCWESELKPPYLMQTGEKQLHGLAVEWLEQIMRSNKIKLEHVVQPWKRCLISLQRGHVDIVPNSSLQESRKNFAYYSDELYRTHLDFYYLKNKIANAEQLTQAEHFKLYVIGGIRGFNYTFYDGLISIETGASNRETLVNKLLKGRVDFAILQREVLASLYRNKQHVLTLIAGISAPENSAKSFYILVGHKHPNAKKIVSMINTGLEEIHQTGVYQQILDKYL